MLPVNESGIAYSTLAVFGVVSLILYLFVLRPLLPRPVPVSPSSIANVLATPSTPVTQQHPIPVQQRIPPHVRESSIASPSSSSSTCNGSAALFLHDNGVVKWQCCRVSMHPATDADRRDRARLLSRLFVSSSSVSSQEGSSSQQQQPQPQPSPPPTKGSVIVVSVPVQDLECSHLRKILYLLATYYNLIVIVVVENGFDRKNKSNLLQRLRADGTLLSTEILPDHRVVLSSTTSGRVAFCRQMQRLELILDFDDEVQSLLDRFGYRVILYRNCTNDPALNPSTTNNSSCLSSLGKILYS